MNIDTVNSSYQSTPNDCLDQEKKEKISPKSLQDWLEEKLRMVIKSNCSSIVRVANRFAHEIERVCQRSDRIQNSGKVYSWKLSLADHRLQKCLVYYQLGLRLGRVELHSNLSAMVYRYITHSQSQLRFAARYNLIEDFLQEFYANSLKVFRRENEVTPNYQPRTKLELAEYMAFTEQYAKRSITLPQGYSQQLIILRAQTFARRQPKDAVVDIEQAAGFSQGDDLSRRHNLGVIQQIREQMVAQTKDNSDSLLRDRLISSLFQYFESQNHSDCADYLTLKLQDLTASEINEILGLTPRQRDYLQQRFKYHVEKFARSSHWEIVHQWLGAELNHRLGMTSKQWQEFISQLSPQQQEILQLKQQKKNNQEIAQIITLTSKKVQKQWMLILEIAWRIRNN